MELPFLNRRQEIERLIQFAGRTTGSLAVVYGRRRCGKSRLLVEGIPQVQLVYHLADEREPVLQRAALASSIARVKPGFNQVHYPDWNSLFQRWWQEAPAGAVLAIDEFPALVMRDPALSSLLQGYVDQRPAASCHLLICGSSQRLMQGLVLDRTAPLYGRAAEIMRIRPLPPGWICEGLNCTGIEAIEAYSVWGGIPRHWELAREFPDLATALQRLVFDPLGVLHDEPNTLLLDDLRDSSQASSLLQLVGQGCHRLSEIAARLGKTSGELVRPMQRLLELELLSKELPFDSMEKDSKKTTYRIADPFLAFWFRYVAPHRSWLAERLGSQVWAKIQQDFPAYVGEHWEKLARWSVPHLSLSCGPWGPARRWWGSGANRRPLEIDVVARNFEGSHLLVGSVKWSEKLDFSRWVQELQTQAQMFQPDQKKVLALWVKAAPNQAAQQLCRQAGVQIFGPDEVLAVLR